MSRPKKQTVRSAAILLIGKADASADFRYAAGFAAPDNTVLLIHNGHRHMVVAGFETDRARRECRDATVWSPSDLKLDAGKSRDVAAWCGALLRQQRIRGVRVPWDFPCACADALRRQQVKVCPQFGMLFPERAVKHAAEIIRMRRAQRAAVDAMRAAVACIRGSRADARGVLRLNGRVLTSEHVRACIDQVLLSHDCVCDDVIVAGGRQGAFPHERGQGPLRARAPIVIDIFPRHRSSGYWGDLTRTVCKGDPGTAVRRMERAVRQAHGAAMKAVRPRVAVGTVHRIAAETLAGAGFETHQSRGAMEGFIHSTGHGVGLDIHEQPAVSHGSTRLRAGNVITIEPGLYYRKIGGIRIEDTVEVTADGCRRLVAMEYPFVL